jgi:uncharacterized protein YjiS (DUF1127 family)
MEYVIKTHGIWSGWQRTGGALLTLAVVLPWAWLQRARRRRELMGLLGQPDYLLKDVGLDRSQITREGLKPFWTP